MKVRQAAAAAAVCMAVMLTDGCEMLNQEEEWTPKESSAVSIDENGMITEYISDTLDESYYSASELESMIRSEVEEYNKANGENSITVAAFSVEDQAVSLTMEYAKAADYAAFNNVEFYFGSMINAQLEGYLFDGTFKKVKNGVVESSSASGSDVLQNMAAEVLVVTAPLEVHVPGKVIYTTTNAEILAADDVNATGKTDADSENTGLQLPSNNVYTGQEKSFAEKAEANRVYIIYE